MGPIKVLIKQSCPLGLRGMLTVAHIARSAREGLICTRNTYVYIYRDAPQYGPHGTDSGKGMSNSWKPTFSQE